MPWPSTYTYISVMVSDSGVLTFEGEQIMPLPVASEATED